MELAALLLSLFLGGLILLHRNNNQSYLLLPTLLLLLLLLLRTKPVRNPEKRSFHDTTVAFPRPRCCWAWKNVPPHSVTSRSS